MTKEQLEKLDAMAKPRSEEAIAKAEERKKRWLNVQTMTKEEMIKSWVAYRGEANVTADQLQAIKWAWEALRGKGSQMPCRYRAKQLGNGQWVEGWYVRHHFPITDSHNNVIDYEEVPMLFNDDEGERNKGGYWHTIDQTTLEQVPQEQKINFLDL